MSKDEQRKYKDAYSEFFQKFFLKSIFGIFHRFSIKNFNLSWCRTNFWTFWQQICHWIEFGNLYYVLKFYIH